MGNEFELTRRKALAGIGAIGAASVGAGLGTSAYFSDRETFDGNTLTAGELDLRIDWQQLYFGPEGNADHYAPYGKADYPFVNAHPDHNKNGMQSLDLGEIDYGEFADDDYVVTYMDEVDDPVDGANIQEYLTCETLENFEVPADFYNGVRRQDSLIELEDVKPGDCGEVTFSLHLCDNPGYIWWIGQKAEFDEELAKAIKVKAWYDLECTNVFDEDDGDKIFIESTTLYDFLNNRLSPEGRMLNPGVYDLAIAPGSVEENENGGEVDCVPLGKVEFGSDGVDDVEDGSVEYVEEDPLRIGVRFVAPDGYEMVVEFSEIIVKTNADDEVQAQNLEDYDLGEIVEFDWAIVDEPGDTGMCKMRIKAGSDDPTEFDLLQGGCTTSQTNVRTPGEHDKHGHPLGISFIEFDYCATDDPPGMCFPDDETICVAMEWCLPTTKPRHVDDINDLQGQSISFDLGFYTEQCRHNPDPSGPSGFV